MKRIISTLLLATVSMVALADTRKLVLDCEALPEGEPPKEVFVVEGKFSIVARDGNKALEIGVSEELSDSNALIGDSAAGSASFEARVLATKVGRSTPRFGIGVHGQSGYRILVFPAKKELQLTKGDEIIKTVPFDWKSDAWLKLKLDVKKVAEGKWTITAKAWPASDPEPKEAQFTHEDATLKGQGKCSIWGTLFSGTPIYFDDLKVELE